MASEITEDEDQNSFFFENKEAEKMKIRKIIDYQKSLYFSSSSSSSSSFSSSTCSSKNNKLFGLMREGNTSLRRLFDMEHTSLANHFNDYSVSPIIKPILLWGSDSDDEGRDDPWGGITQLGGDFRSRIGDEDGVVWSQKNCNNKELMQGEKRSKRKLMRTKSYKRLPRLSLWRCGRFKFKLKLIRKLRVIIRGRIL